MHFRSHHWGPGYLVELGPPCPEPSQALGLSSGLSLSDPTGAGALGRAPTSLPHTCCSGPSVVPCVSVSPLVGLGPSITAYLKHLSSHSCVLFYTFKFSRAGSCLCLPPGHSRFPRFSACSAHRSPKPTLCDSCLSSSHSLCIPPHVGTVAALVHCHLCPCVF